MPTPKRFTDEELRAHKNARAAQRYIENKEKISAYHSALHASKKSDPEYMKRLAEKSVAYRAAHPDYTKKMNAKRRADHPEREKARCREWFANNPDKVFKSVVASRNQMLISSKIKRFSQTP